jgi:integrase
MRTIHQLTAKAVDAFTEPRLYSDGGGLYFQITKRGSRSWILRFHLNGKVRDMGLGPAPSVTLKDARQLAEAARKLVRDGADPILARDQSRQTAAAALTVTQAVEGWLAAQRPKWQTWRHAARVAQRLRDYVFPTIGSHPIAGIGPAEIKRALAPIWVVKHPTAERVRADLQDVIDWAIAEGHRADESNPAEARRLKHSLPAGLRKVQHFASLSYSEAPRFLAELRRQDGIAARALELILLTAVRVGDVCGGGRDLAMPMRWADVVLANRAWIIPVTKTGKSLTVPLSDPVVKLLGEMRPFRDPDTDFVFPGRWGGSVVNAATLRRVLDDMGYDVTVHGLRGTFKTWASETTAFPRDVVEMALAHSQSALDAAYMRGDLLAKRARLMSAWAEFLERDAVREGSTVVALR